MCNMRELKKNHIDPIAPNNAENKLYISIEELKVQKENKCKTQIAVANPSWLDAVK